MSSFWLLSLIFSITTLRFIASSTIHKIERNFKSSIDGVFGNVTTTRPEGLTTNQTLKNAISYSEHESTNSDTRILNEYTRHTVFAQSLTQELYGIIDFPQGATTATFQEIYDEHVESYFSLNINPSLLLDSTTTITNIVVPSIANRYLRKKWRNLDIFRRTNGKHEGSSVIISYDQQISYYFPTASGTLTLESLVTLPFLTESGRNEFNLKLKGSDDLILQDVIGVSEVALPAQSPEIQLMPSQTKIPAEPVSEIGPSPQISTSQPSSLTRKPTNPPANSPTASPSTRSPPAPPGQTQNIGGKPTEIPTKLPAPSKPPVSSPSNPPVSSPSNPPVSPPSNPPVQPPSNPPVQPPSNPPVSVPTKTARPTLAPTKIDTLKTDDRSGGISGLIVIGSLMAVLFIAFIINMKYCMGEYVD